MYVDLADLDGPVACVLNAGITSLLCQASAQAHLHIFLWMRSVLVCFLRTLSIRPLSHWSLMFRHGFLKSDDNL